MTRYGGDELLNVPAWDIEGRRMSIEFSAALLRDDAGEIEGISAVIRDVTDHWNENCELRSRLAELECAADSGTAAD